MAFVLFLLPWLFADPQPGGISGATVNLVTRQPVNRAEIALEPASDGAGKVYLVTTDREGGFRLSDIPPGQYRLKGTHNGYLPSWFRVRRGENRGSIITLSAGETIRNLRLEMIPQGVIAGTVRDSDGEALSGVSIVAIRAEYSRRGKRLGVVGTAETDDLGQYRIQNLGSGKYYLRANPNWPPEQRKQLRREPDAELLLSSVYPAGQVKEQARPVSLEPGARMTGIDFILPRARTVTVSGHAVTVPNARLTNVTLTAGSDPNDQLAFRIDGRIDAKGDFEFSFVPEGLYLLTAGASTPSKPTTSLMDLLMGDRKLLKHVPVTVGKEAVRNVQLAIDAGGEVKGIVAMNDGSELPARSRIGFSDGLDEFSVPVSVKGEFESDLSPGRYSVRVWSESHWISGMSAGQRDILHEGLTISGAGTIDLRVVLSKAAGKIEGLVVDDEGKPAAGATVVLIPETAARSRFDLFRDVQTDQNGHFRIEAAPDGRFGLYAWDVVERGAWWDAEFLADYESKRVQVTVSGSQQIHVADLRLLRVLPH